MQHLLYLTHRIPFPPNKGDKVRSYHLLEHLRQHYRVHLGTFIDDKNDWQYVDTIKAICGECYFAELNPLKARVRSARGLLSNQPLTLPYYFDNGLRSWVNNLLDRLSIKHIVVFSSALAQYVMHADETYRLIDFVDVDSDKWRQYAFSCAWPANKIYEREAKLLLNYERKVANAFDASTFVTDAEVLLFKGLAPESANKIYAVNNGVDFDYFDPHREYSNPYSKNEQVIVFTGAMDYWPNVDAVDWFARYVFPKIVERFTNARFYIVGSRPTAAVSQLSQLSGVVVTGSVPDIRPYLAHAQVAVAPLRIARGVQNKVLEAMAMSKPIIVTSQAAAGVDAVPGRDFVVAATAEEFLSNIAAIFEQGDRALSLATSARQRVLEKYSWNKNLSVLTNLLGSRFTSLATSNEQKNISTYCPDVSLKVSQ